MVDAEQARAELEDAGRVDACRPAAGSDRSRRRSRRSRRCRRRCGSVVTIEATPDVPIETATSPSRRPSPGRRPCCRPCRGRSAALAVPADHLAGRRRCGGAGRRGRAPRSSEVGQPGVVRGRPVAGAGGVAAVGGGLGAATGELPGEVVVGEQHVGGCGRRASGSWSRIQRSLVTVYDASKHAAGQLGAARPGHPAPRPGRRPRRRCGRRSRAARRGRGHRARRGPPCRAAARRRRPPRRGRAGPAVASSSALEPGRAGRRRCRTGGRRERSSTTRPSWRVHQHGLGGLGGGVDAEDEG